MKKRLYSAIRLLILCGCLLVLLYPQARLNSMNELPIVSVPVQLSIKRIEVRANIESVGLVGDAMAVPTSAEDVGWYNAGIRPGDIGSAVLAGHVNWKNGGNAVFTYLHLLQVGDVVSVTDNLHNTEYFIVRDVKQYPVDADTEDVFVSNDGRAHLNLITCDGAWSVARRTHVARLVVFTDKV